MPHGPAAGTRLQGIHANDPPVRTGRAFGAPPTGGRALSGGRPLGDMGPLRYPGAVATFYLGLLALLLIEQFVVRVPPRGYLDVAILFAGANVVLALQRARAGLLAHGTFRGAVMGVLPVALVGSAVGGTIVAVADSEPATIAVVAGSLLFMILFVSATAGWQYVRVGSSGREPGED